MKTRSSFVLFETGFSSKSEKTAISAIVAFITAAKISIDVACYQMSNAGIIAALSKAARRGVKVRAVYDSALSGDPGPATLAKAGIEGRVNRQYGIMHHKFMIADSSAIQTGSFNYSKGAATANAENVLIVRKAPPSLVNSYQGCFAALFTQAAPLGAQNV